MPILFMALIALAVFLAIPIMGTAAVIAEHHFRPKPAAGLPHAVPHRGS